MRIRDIVKKIRQGLCFHCYSPSTLDCHVYELPGWCKMVVFANRCVKCGKERVDVMPLSKIIGGERG